MAWFFAAGSPLEVAVNLLARVAADSVTRRGTQKAYASAGEFKSFCGALGKPTG